MFRQVYQVFLMSLLLIASIPAAAQNSHKEINRQALIADSLDLLARKLLLKGKRDSARILLDKAIEYAHMSGNSTILARSYIDLANLFLLQGKYQLAEENMELARPYLEMTDHYEVRITGLLQRANLYNVLNKKDSSIYYYGVAEKYNAEKFPYRNWVVYMALGELFNQTDDIATAKKYLQKAYELSANREGKPDHIYVLTVFINFYMMRKMTSGAGELIAEYNALVEERKRKNVADPMYAMVASLTNLRLEENVDFMKAVREKAMKEGDIVRSLIINSYIITYYERRKDYTNALSYAEDAVEMAEHTSGLLDIYLARKTKYALLKKAGQFAEANAVADTLFAIKDSILVSQKREQLYELETRFESERKEKEIELLTSKNELKNREVALLMADKKMASLLFQQQLLKQDALTRENSLMDSIVKSEQAYNAALNKEKQREAALNDALGRENELKAAKLRKEKNLRGLLIGGTVVLLLAGAIILVQYRKQRSKSEIIQRQSDDMQVLMKEIHHRVKNNLQVISSLLDLQSHTITDLQASEAVKEGKNRVQSMALIHQNLYSEGNIRGIRTKDYISNLLQSLCDSYNITSEKVRINMNIDDLNLDVDTMIPLGLVLNELVSNSFKYAFTGARQGELDLTLIEEGNQLFLKVRDNGVGYPEGLNIKEGKSFGLKLIRAFAQKLKASLEIYNANGAVLEMRISKYTSA